MCQRIVKLFKTIARAHGAYIGADYTSTGKERIEQWNNAIEIVKEVEPIAAEIEDEFRRLLGVEEEPQKAD